MSTTIPAPSTTPVGPSAADPSSRSVAAQPSTNPNATTDQSAAAEPQPEVDLREVDLRIGVLREQIDSVDAAIIRMVSERIELSKNVGRLRRASGGPRLSLRRENQIIAKFGAALGSEGTSLAMLLLKASRGRM